MEALRVAVIAVGAVLGVLAIVAAATEIPSFWDPCKTWGPDSGGTMSLSPGEACRGKSATSETKPQAVLRMTAVFGTATVAGGLAIWAAARRAAAPAGVAAGLLAFESGLLFLGISAAFGLTLAGAILFFIAALRWRSRPPAPAATVSQPL
jgi:hypothetical protein